MQTINYILKDIRPFGLKDDVGQMKKSFELYSYSHLPVVDKKLFYGAVSRQEIEILQSEKVKLNDLRQIIEPFYVTENMNWFEVLQNSLLKSTLHAKVSSPSGLLTLNNLGNYAVGMQIRSGNVLCLV